MPVPLPVPLRVRYLIGTYDFKLFGTTFTLFGGFSSSPVVVRCASLFIGQAASYGTECRTHPDPSMGLYFYVKIRISEHFIRQLQCTLKTLFPQVVEY